MTNLQWNLQNWNDAERWKNEWREGYAWGPREMVRKDFDRFVAPFLPPGKKPDILEIACGMGRFTEFLLGVAGSVHSIDLAPHCVASCSERFRDRENFKATVTDGKTLPEGVFDMVVSYDSLVHADMDVIKAYLDQCADVLRPGGHVAIHHANRPDLNSSRMDVRSEQVFEHVQTSGKLRMVAQTLFRLTEGQFIDCFTVAQRV